MRLALDHLISSGAFADVFKPPADPFVLKLFRRKPLDPEGRAVRAIFDAEMAGYRVGHSHSELAPHLPEFFGHCEIEDVIDASGRSHAAKYWLSCCYRLEFLPGAVCKIWDTPEQYHQHLESLLDRFYEAGIQYAADGDVWNWEDQEHCKFVDVALRDAAADYMHLLYDERGILVQ